MPHVLVEIVISFCLGTFAFALTDRQADTWYDEIDSLLPVCDSVEGNCGFYILTSDRSKGHQIIGVLLAFLVVFRSQIAWGMYMEGRNAVGRVVAMGAIASSKTKLIEAKWSRFGLVSRKYPYRPKWSARVVSKVRIKMGGKNAGAAGAGLTGGASTFS